MRLAAVLMALTAASAAQAASLSPLDADPATLALPATAGAIAPAPGTGLPLVSDHAQGAAPLVRIPPPATLTGGLLLARDDPGGATLPLPAPAAR